MQKTSSCIYGAFEETCSLSGQLLNLAGAVEGVGALVTYRVSVRQTCVSRVFPAPVGSSRYRQEWTWARTPSGSTSGCSVDTEDR